jgi:3-methylornithyl-N6-L-lysine dehydrogenase
VTRLTERDMKELGKGLDAVERRLERLTGLDLAGVGARAFTMRPDAERENAARISLTAARVAVVPISSGKGTIPRFVDTVATLCARVGCDSYVTSRPDVSGFWEAFARRATLVFAADDHQFLAINPRRGRVADNDRCTANAYVAALDAAADGVAGKNVLVVGMGPVGKAAASRLLELGAVTLIAEKDQAKAAAALFDLPAVELVDTDTGLGRCRLVVDATPSRDFVAASWVRKNSIVAAPGWPCGVTKEGREALGDRLIHEPLALGVAAMAADALLGSASRRKRADAPWLPAFDFGQ